AFQSLCSATGGDYAAVVKAADAGGWAATAEPTDADDTIVVNEKAARAKTDNGETLTLFATSGVRHGAGGDIPVSTCKISSNKPDADLLAHTQAWLGYAPDSGDAGLAVYYVKSASPKPTHVGKDGVGAAMAAGSVSVVKVQQDPNGAILVYQTFHK